MTVQECIKYVEDHLEIRPAKKNGAYKSGRVLSPVQGCVNHSVGCAQPSVDVFYNLMNTSSAGWGVNALLGDFHKGEGRIILALKENARPWGCAKGKYGSWNNSRIQWEVCEPAGHTYAGGRMINYDVKKNQGYFERMWKMLVAWNVYCVVKFGYPVSCIADHAESHKAGYGSNHGDLGHWIPKHGKNMDMLRAEVQAILNNKNKEDELDMTKKEFIDSLTNEEAYTLLTKANAYVASLEEPKWSKDEGHWQYAKNKGIVDGSNPCGNLKRIEFAAVMGRLGLLK
jgi:hypothetical protein